MCMPHSSLPQVQDFTGRSVAGEGLRGRASRGSLSTRQRYGPLIHAGIWSLSVGRQACCLAAAAFV